MAAENNNITEEKKSLNFIEAKVEKDLAEGKNGGRIQTRFPPEPNGYLHIGHAKAIAIDFGIAQKYGGVCNLRMDDTNPQKEDTEYVEAIKRDIEWLGFKWGNILYASDYFQKLWDLAVELIKRGKAYVDEQTAEQIAAQKGTPTQPGQNSPYRDRPVEESLRLFEEMNSGNMEPGKMVLRAKIDMASDNMHFRDPIMYRVLNMPHWRTGNKWNAYPMYDYTHGQCDYWEGVTHSLCTLEFVSHRPLYDLFVDWAKEVAGDDKPLDDNRPRQIEFNRLNLTYTVMSKRKLRYLVENGYVSGWDDPRMPTLCGLRRRGYTPVSIRNFSERNGVSKVNSTVEYSFLEHCLREDLNENAQRAMAVLRPVKLTIVNYPEGKSETFEVENNPNRPEDGTRTVTFSRDLWIEQEDFMEEPVKGYFRLFPGNEVRLKTAYIVRCVGCVKDEEGHVIEVQAEYDPNSRGGDPADGRKIKGTIHWVDAHTALKAEVRLYENLFSVPDPDNYDYLTVLNPQSLTVLPDSRVEASLSSAKPGDSFQFMRQGYFCVDNRDSREGALVFNRSVSLKDGFKQKKK